MESLDSFEKLLLLLLLALVLIGAIAGLGFSMIFQNLIS